MSHRGRLNVIINIVSRPAAESLRRLRGCRSAQRARRRRASGIRVGATVHLEHRGQRPRRANPHGLQSQPPRSKPSIRWRWGARRAKQTRLGSRREGHRVLPVLMHGDTAFRRTGHHRRDAEPCEPPRLYRRRNRCTSSSTTCSDSRRIRAMPTPAASRRTWPSGCRFRIFHVNGEDVDAVVRAGRMALEYRYEFSSDVVVDLIGFRRHGHSEVDDPTITQPILVPQDQRSSHAVRDLCEECRPRFQAIRREVPG